ncbi:transposable element Tc1 transposase [Caerostris extrusa]|uniref:Transposable element Tc1 transposase n=1 Tax=Caerostris extrusa TaxID=172846 RepID=A0AAV4UT55_CAEEX|nr:transposable element Tc1 transposase [Caerostris extrusa]
MALIREECQQASGSIVSMNTIRKEAHLHGFHGRAAAHKPLITKSNRAARLMWCKAHRNWTVDQWKRILWSSSVQILIGSQCTTYEKFLNIRNPIVVP